jgi:hypothetical protein
MALGTALTSDILALFNSMPATAHDAAVGLAQAYYSYTSTALFGLSVPVITTAMRDAMQATLETGLAVPGLPATIAGAYGASLAVFWTGVPVAGGSGAGTTTGCPGASAAIATLTAVFANLANTSSTAAAGIAVALQVATLTMTCTLTLPPNPPVVTPIA